MDLHAALRDPELLALRVSASELFGVLTRRVQGPSTFAALVLHDDGAMSLAASGVVDASNTREVCFVRTTALALRFDAAAISSADDFPCNLQLHLTVHVVPERSDVESFVRTLLGSARRASAQRAAQYFEADALRMARDYCRQRDAESLLSGRDDAELSQRVQAALKPLAFAAGMAIAPGVVLRVACPAFDAHRKDRRDALAREQRAQEQLRARRVADHAAAQHAESVAGVMRRLSELAARTPNARLSDLIGRFSPTERAELYRLQMERALSPTPPVALVVAGHELVWINTRDGAILRRRPFPEGLGPLRSIRAGQVRGAPVWLIGAATGVYVYDPRQDKTTAYPRDVTRNPRGGMNAVAVVDDHLYATHSELGVTRWSINHLAADGTGKPGTPVLTDHKANATSIRDIQADAHGALWLAIGDRVIGWTPQDGGAALAHALPQSAAQSHSTQPAQSAPTTDGTLISMASIAGSRGGAPAVGALCVTSDTVFAGASDGRLLEWPKADPARHKTLLNDEGGCIDSVSWIEQDGVERLLVTARRAAASLLVRGDSHRTDYRADEPLRWAAMCDAAVLAINDRRDRIYIWQASRPDKPEQTVHLARLVGHSIQDAVIAPESS